jgi:hypothetical protein
MGEFRLYSQFVTPNSLPEFICMRIAILSADTETLHLIQAAFAAGHDIVTAYDCDHILHQLGELNVAPPSGTWERLLHEPDCDVVVVGRADDESLRAEKLRKLVQAAMPLIVVHPICDMLLGFELQMIQKDSHSPIVPYFPGLAHPICSRLTELCDRRLDSPLGESRQLVMERTIPASSPAEVQSQFARDALLFRRLVGRIDRLGAMGAQPYPSDDWSNLSVHMTTRDETIVRWSVNRLEDTTADLTVTGENDRAKATMPSDLASWTLEGPEISTPEYRESDAWPFEAVEQFSDDPTFVNELWDDACRAVELSDTIDQSYRRGKTIELYHEEHSEEDTFKSIMAAGGCLALMLTLLVLPLFAVIESLEIGFLNSPRWQEWPWKLIYWRNWPVYLLIALALFLSLQFLRILFWNSPTSTDASGSES